MTTTTRTVVPLHELLAGATERTPMRPPDGLSDVPMERLVVDGQRCVLKLVSPELDWVMRMVRDTVCRPALVWESGLLDRVADHVDALVLAVGHDATAGTWGLLMRDATGDFLPDGAAPIPVARQDAFLRDMAGMHAATWGMAPVPGLATPEDAYHLFSPAALEAEARRGPLTGVPAAVAPGKAALRSLVPGVAEDLEALSLDVAPLVAALAETPRALVHHDWKGGNLGTRADGRTILVDWAFPGVSAGCADLAWYLACNCDRLQTSKEQVIAQYRRELERAGVDTDGWFERQLELALLGSFLTLGWSKTGDAAELGWWVERTAGVARDLLR